MSKFFEAEHLCVEHVKTRTRLVRNVSFSLSPGSSLVVLGQSGCGKSMTCHAIMGLLDAKRFNVTGSMVFDGQNLLTISPKERQKLYGGAIAMIPQNPMTAFDPSIRIGRQMQETLALHTDFPAAALRLKIGQALERAGLAEVGRVCHSYPHTLSGGMLQRVMIAMALMVDARLVVADEPTAALDVVHRNVTVESFVALREQGAAVLLVTHDLSVAVQLGGMLLVMKDGEIIESGTVPAVMRSPQHPYTMALLDAHRLSTHAPRAREAAVC